jgi:hypothetical protein
MSEMEDWVATRPKWVQEAFAEFPCGAQIDFEDGPWYVLGYADGVKGEQLVIITQTNPYHDYDRAVEGRRMAVHLDCLRKSARRVQ